MKGKVAAFLENEAKIMALLVCFHLFLIGVAYQIRVRRGVSDAHLYWAQTFDINNYAWFDFADYGTSFILFLNYPFLKLGLPFFAGFLLYGIVGFVGIVTWVRWSEWALDGKFLLKGYNILPLFFFLPNLHYWTASLGKEALIFFGIAYVFYSLATERYKTFAFIASCMLILLVRPHVALMLLASIALVKLFDKSKSFKKRIGIASLSFTVLSVILYMVFQLSGIRRLNWKRILYFNDYSILSFRRSGSYVPMLEYHYPYKLFSFNFRPLFYDSRSIVQFMAGLENGFLLLLCLFALYFVLKFYTRIHFAQWMQISFLYAFISSLMYVQRYANLGIFMRTKIMFQPFMVIALLCIIKQGLALNKSKT